MIEVMEERWMDDEDAVSGMVAMNENVMDALIFKRYA